MNNFDFLDNLPLLIFTSVFLLISIIFIRGAIILLRSEENSEEKLKGTKILSKSLYGFSALIVVALIFLILSYILGKGERILPQPSSEEFPISPSVNFPAPPDFITIGGYCFEGPYLLSKEQKFIGKTAIYVVLCQKNEEYVIIYIGETKEGQDLLAHEQYDCWKEKCEKFDKNLYSGIFSTSLKKYSDAERLRMKQSLEAEINPPCLDLE
jgi:hypothetical protein